MFQMKRSAPQLPDAQSGQAALETALVLPLMVFMILGIIQLGLIAQARAMAKYAAYRAVRVGAMHNADLEKMEAAALFHLLPVLPLRSGGGANAGETILPTTNVSQVLAKFTRARAENELISGLNQVSVVICGPLKSELEGSASDPLAAVDHQSRHGVGSSDEVDFDDPAVATDSGGVIGESPAMITTLRNHLRTKLRIQVQLHYRMPIPFANWVIAHSYIGMKLPAVLRLGKETGPLPPVQAKFLKVKEAADNGIYVVPINVNYAMRMQSNLFLSANPPPDSNDCVHYAEAL